MSAAPSVKWARPGTPAYEDLLSILDDALRVCGDLMMTDHAMSKGAAEAALAHACVRYLARLETVHPEPAFLRMQIIRLLNAEGARMRGLIRASH